MDSMTYRVSELGFDCGTFTSLPSALRRVAKVIAKNDTEGESSYILVHDSTGRTVLHIHEVHPSKVYAPKPMVECPSCDGDGFDGTYTESCGTCFGCGKIAAV